MGNCSRGCILRESRGSALGFSEEDAERPETNDGDIEPHGATFEKLSDLPRLPWKMGNRLPCGKLLLVSKGASLQGSV